MIDTLNAHDSTAGISQLSAYMARREEAEKECNRVIGEFTAAALQADMDAPANFAPLVTDYKQEPWGANGYRPKRVQTVGEVLVDSLDYSNGPTFDEALALLGKAAGGEDVQMQARKLISRMASKWVEMNID